MGIETDSLYSIDFGSKEIRFRLDYSERKSLGIKVTPEMEVYVKAPANATLDKVKEKVYKRAPWIIRQQNFFLSFHPKSTQRKFINGETHLYLGRQYRLKVNELNGVKKKFKNEQVKLNSGFIEVHTIDKLNAKNLIQEWYLSRARVKFHEIAQPLFEKFVKKHGLNYKYQLVIRNMPLRWGSCTPKGKIILNPELIKAPKGSIEYVIIHELCHLKHRDHTKKFIDLQTREMPDWEKWKLKLEKLLA